MRLTSVILAICLYSLQALHTYAIPARPGKFLWTMPDGQKVWLTLHGDEYSHYYMTEDGQKLVTDDNGQLVPIDLTQRQGEGISNKSPRRVSIDGMLTNYPTIGSPNALVLLVEYQDVKFKTQNANHEFSRLMNEPGYDYNGATGSVLDYFRDNSCGLFTPNFTVCGPVTLPHTMAYYGAATANSHDACPWEMVADGCRLLKEQQPDIDFSKFDNDGDGVVDNVFVFYAGYGQNAGASTSTVWPHAANITWYGLNVVIDGVKIDNYACTNEITGNESSGGDRCGIGTFCHEFSHVLGLPDLYSTNYSSAFTPGQYELMDTGPYNNNGNTPPYMSVYDRMTLRWINPRELTAPENLSLYHVGDEAEMPDGASAGYIIKTINENEYFLLENRQQVGWDRYIPGHGMLVWHIDFDETAFSQNALNNNPSHQRVDIIEADGLRTDESRSGDPFPGRTGVTQLTDYSSPSMATWTGTLVGKPLTDITEIDGVITFKVMGGGQGVPMVRAGEAEAVTPTSFRAVWDGNVSISTYEVDVCRGEEVVPFVTLTKTITSLADCFVDVVGLDPDATYNYCVRSVDGAARSANSNVVYVRTLPPSFDMLVPEALDADNVAADGFTARWMPLDGADGYLLDVYTKAYVEPVYDVVDFTGGLTALPDGWTTSSTSTSGVAGTFGDARPSLLFKNDQDFITSPVYDIDLNSVGFWIKGSSNFKGTLTVEALVGNAWTAVSELAPTSTASENMFPLPTGARRIRLIVSVTSGTLYLDDIVLAYNGAAQLNHVAGYERLFVDSDKTSCNVVNLSPSTEYFYMITAVSGTFTSHTSDEVRVTTLTPDGIVSVKAQPVSRPRLIMSNGQLRILMPSGKTYLFR